MNQERIRLINRTFLLVIIFVALIVITDWFFMPDAELLTEGVIGMIIGNATGWWGAYVAFYTTDESKGKEQ